MKYTAGPFTWNTKKAAGEFFSNLLFEAIPIHVVDDLEMHHCLLGLIAQHPESEMKIGVGVDRFEIRRNPVFKNQNTFFLVRTDGTETDFSFRSCLSGKPKTNWSLFCSAAREAVTVQIIDFKSACFRSAVNPVCSITGDPITWDDCHVDHVVEFSELLKRFVKENEIDTASAVTAGADRQIQPIFSCSELRSRWAEYHRQHAELRLTTAEANLARNKRV